MPKNKASVVSFESHALFHLMRDYPTDFRFFLDLNFRIANMYPDLLNNGICHDPEKTHMHLIGLMKQEPEYGEDMMEEIARDIGSQITHLYCDRSRPYLFVVGKKIIDPNTFIQMFRFFTIVEYI